MSMSVVMLSFLLKPLGDAHNVNGGCHQITQDFHCTACLGT